VVLGSAMRSHREVAEEQRRSSRRAIGLVTTQLRWSGGLERGKGRGERNEEARAVRKRSISCYRGRSESTRGWLSRFLTRLG
jgi:hypothetical protein